MKRVLNLLGAFAILLGVSGCATTDGGVTDIVKVGGSDVTLYAQSPSRTTNEGVYTLWSEGDKINVFHSVSGAENYLNDNAFTLQEGAADSFVGNLCSEGTLVSGTTYD